MSFPSSEPVKESPSDTGATPKKKTKTNPPRAISPEVARRRMTTPVVAPRSGLNPPPLTLPRQRAPTPLFPERRPREACSMPISGRHDLPLATFNLPSRNNSQSNRKRIPKPKPPRAVTLWRHACLTTPERVKESPNPPNPSCCRSCGGMRGWLPLHSPAEQPPSPRATCPQSPNNPSCQTATRLSPPLNGGEDSPPTLRPTHAPVQNKRQQRPH